MNDFCDEISLFTIQSSELRANNWNFLDNNRQTFFNGIDEPMGTPHHVHYRSQHCVKHKDEGKSENIGFLE